MIKHFIIYLSCILFFACSEKTNEQKQIKTLSVSLKPNEEVSSSLFKNIEIIPLETKEESLITSIGRIREYNNKIYILDDKISVLFFFDKNGKYLSKIDKNGEGPEDYYLIYETVIKPEENQIYMISPMGFLHIYDLEGNFIKKIQLPHGGQTDMIDIDKNTIAYWILGGNNNKINIIDTNTEETINSFWGNTDYNFISNWCIDVFYKYKNENFFSTQFSNEIYKLTKDTVEIVYKWDFGKDNLNLKPYTQKAKEDPNIISHLTKTMEIPYNFSRQFQNKDYYYTVLQTWPISRWRNVFYRKKDGKSFVFDTLPGGAKVMNTLIFTDEYMISVISPEDVSSYQKILSPEEYEKVKDIKEDDNLCLVKFYFK